MIPPLLLSSLILPLKFPRNPGVREFQPEGMNYAHDGRREI